MSFAGIHQSPYHSTEEGPVSCGRFKRYEFGQSLFRMVSRQVKNKLDHPRLGVNDTRLFRRGIGRI